MEIQTASGKVIINKRTIYGNWLQGYKQSGAFTGAFTLRKAWDNFCKYSEEIGTMPKGKAAKLAGFVQGMAFRDGATSSYGKNT